MDKNNKITEIKGYTKYLDLSHRYYILTPLTKQALSDLYDANFINAENRKVKEEYSYMEFDEETFLLMEEYLFNFISVECNLIITMYEEEWAEGEMLNDILKIAERMINNSDNEKFIELAQKFLVLVKIAIEKERVLVFYF